MHSTTSLPRNLARANRGFTLIEVLVAMLVLAVGLLGVAALQLRGLQYNHDAYLRSQSSILAYDIADRMRLNRDNANAYRSDYTIPTSRPTDCIPGPANVSVTNDLDCWHQQLYDALPPGRDADIVQETNGEYTVRFTWTDRENQSREIEYTFLP